MPRITAADFNLLSSKWGRAVALFFFYFIDGVLISFMLTPIAMRMAERNVSAADVGLFGSIVYLPASMKWIFGPLVDLCYSKRLGRRRGWILGAEATINLTVSYSSFWHGWAVGKWGYPATMILDAGSDLICLPLLPFMAPAPKKAIEATEHNR